MMARNAYDDYSLLTDIHYCVKSTASSLAEFRQLRIVEDLRPPAIATITHQEGNNKASTFHEHHLSFKGDVWLHHSERVPMVKELREGLGLAQNAIIDWSLLMAFIAAVYKGDTVLASIELEGR